MNIGVDALRAIVGPGVNNETIVGMNVSTQSAYVNKIQNWREWRKRTLPYPQHGIQNLAPRLDYVEDGLRHTWSCAGVLEDVAEEKSSLNE